MRILFKVLVITCVLYIFLAGVSTSYADQLISSWSQTLSLPYIDTAQTAFSFANKIYILGGATQTGQSHYDVLSSVPNSNGTLNTWLNEESFPKALIIHATAIKDNHVYVLGGKEENPGSSMDYVNYVYLGTLTNSGSISSWQALTPLPKKLASGGAAVVGDYIYYLGGNNEDGGINTSFNTIYYAHINPDGTIGNWLISPTTLPFQMAGFSTVVYNNNIMVVGGVGNNVVLNTVYKFSVDTSDGSLFSWQQLASLPSPTAALNQTIIVDNMLIQVGGSSPNTASVFYAPINQDGTLQPWQTSSNSLPQGVVGGAVAYSNGYLYLTGGSNSSGYLNTVYYAKVNTGNTLSVPLYKQTDPQWANNLYDSANTWAQTGQQGIDRWGCAITSAVMVFRYYGITKLPDGTDLNPGTLNTWLKTTKGGYVNHGWVNWAKLSQLSKVAKSENPGFTSDMLEFDSLNSTQSSFITADLNNSYPDIVQEPGHFVVATGISGSSFTINDPFYSRTLLSDYNNSFLSLKRFVPANSDGSYIELFVDPTVSISVTDQNNQPVGVGSIDQPIHDAIGGEASGPALDVYYIKKPSSGTYFVTISSLTPQSYHLQSDLFDVNAQDIFHDYSGAVDTNHSDTYIISFDHDSVQNDSITKIITLDTLISDIQTLNTNGWFMNNGAYTSLLTHAQDAKKAFDKQKNSSSVQAKLNGLVSELNDIRGVGITEDGYQLLLSDAQYLLSHL